MIHKIHILSSLALGMTELVGKAATGYTQGKMTFQRI